MQHHELGLARVVFCFSAYIVDNHVILTWVNPTSAIFFVQGNSMGWTVGRAPISPPFELKYYIKNTN
jgi:hypothetical protein